MRIGIIGAGFVGLSSALALAKKGHRVTVFEKDAVPGGLAKGFKERVWKWTLEEHYHHLFTSDWSIRDLAQKVGVPLVFKRAKTSTFYSGEVYQLDSPTALLHFPHLNAFEKIRTALVIAYLKIIPWWKNLENKTSENFLSKTMGEKAWEILWQPLFAKKFGKYAKKIPAVWFWARIKKRSASLGYPEGGFQNLANKTALAAKKIGVKFFYKKSILQILPKDGKFLLTTDNRQQEEFDRVICTLPSHLFCQITPNLPPAYVKSATSLKGLGAANLILALKKPFLPNQTYWLNINEKDFPFLAVVEHTNLVNKKHYGGNTLLYVGNYLEATHPFFKKTPQGLFKEFSPYLKKINPQFTKSCVKKMWVSKTPFAQPIIPLNYSSKMPSVQTPINGLYLANIQQVYPWDRGTNYAVELGQKVAQLVT
ncbi:MAG: NAD(P)/FAD-dependent oxidoreductase [Candidatus Blackburnbacteria bacterium]|nr:NAD(P)/FAD-dependent oxidoreductase [Candidatus Blackburnbacteria bacterium]